MSRQIRKLLKAMAVGLVAVSSLEGTKIAAAQTDYPNKTIKIVVGFPAGGAPDITARLLADKLQVVLGQPVIVENLTGAGGNIATRHVAKAEPDGYTLLLAGNGSIVINPSLYETLPYDPLKDLAPISLAAAWPNVLAVSKDVPAKSVQELAALARSRPDELTYGHGGVGISTHLAGEQFKQMGGLAIRPVAFTSPITLIRDVMAGQVSLCFCAITSVMELAKAGKVRALAVTSLERSPIAPDLPTMAEVGFPGFQSTAWFGLMAPVGTPQAVIDKLSGEAAKAIKATDVTQKLKEQGIVTIGSTAAEMSSVMKTDTAYWAKLINAIGLKLK